MPGGTGIFSQAKTYFLNLHPIAKTAWVFLAIGVLFTLVFDAAFWGLIIAAVLGVVVFFLKPRKDGLILVGAAILSTILLLGLSSHHAVQQPIKQLSHKQMLVNQLTFGFRESLLDNTQVLRLHNPNRESIDFYLRCRSRDGSAKTLFVSVAALDTTEIGLLEGWQFHPGDEFEAICEDEVIWQQQVK